MGERARSVDRGFTDRWLRRDILCILKFHHFFCVPLFCVLTPLCGLPYWWQPLGGRPSVTLWLFAIARTSQASVSVTAQLRVCRTTMYESRNEAYLYSGPRRRGSRLWYSRCRP